MVFTRFYVIGLESKTIESHSVISLDYEEQDQNILGTGKVALKLCQSMCHERWGGMDCHYYNHIGCH